VALTEFGHGDDLDEHTTPNYALAYASTFRFARGAIRRPRLAQRVAGHGARCFFSSSGRH
jgi:hypothetical protein